MFATAADGDAILLQYKQRTDLDDAWSSALESAENSYFEKYSPVDEQSKSNVKQLKLDFEDIMGKASTCIVTCQGLLQKNNKHERQQEIKRTFSVLETQVNKLQNYDIAETARRATELIEEIENLNKAPTNRGKRNGNLWWLQRKSKIAKVSQLMTLMRDANGTASDLLRGLNETRETLKGLGGGDDGGKTPPGGEGGKTPATPPGGGGGGKGTTGSVTKKRFVVNFVGPKKKETLTSQGDTDLKLPEGVEDYKRLHLQNDKTIGYDDIAGMHDEFIENQLQDQYTLYDKKGNPIATYNREEQKKSWADEPEDIFVIKNEDEQLLGLCVAYSFSVACQPSQFQDFLSRTGLQKTLYIDKWYAKAGNGMPLLKTVIQTQTHSCDRIMATTLQKNSAAMCKFLFMPDTPFNFCFHRDVEQLIALAKLNNDQANPAALVKNKYKFRITDDKENFTLAQYVLFELASTMTPANNDTTLEHVLESSEITDQPLQKKFEDLDKFAAWCKQIPDINNPLAKNDAVMKKFEKSIEYMDDCRENMALDLDALLKRQRFDFLTKVIRQIEYGFVFENKANNEANEQKLQNLQTQVIEQMKTQYDLVLDQTRMSLWKRK